MVNQVTLNKVEFAKMTHVESMTLRMKDMQDDFDVISHNLSSRMNFDTDINEALTSAKGTQTFTSAAKAFIVLFMCAVQTYFITCIFRTKQSGPDTYGAHIPKTMTQNGERQNLTEMV